MRAFWIVVEAVGVSAWIGYSAHKYTLQEAEHRKDYSAPDGFGWLMAAIFGAIVWPISLLAMVFYSYFTGRVAHRIAREREAAEVDRLLNL